MKIPAGGIHQIQGPSQSRGSRRGCIWQGHNCTVRAATKRPPGCSWTMQSLKNPSCRDPSGQDPSGRYPCGRDPSSWDPSGREPSTGAKRKPSFLAAAAAAAMPAGLRRLLLLPAQPVLNTERDVGRAPAAGGCGGRRLPSEAASTAQCERCHSCTSQ